MEASMYILTLVGAIWLGEHLSSLNQFYPKYKDTPYCTVTYEKDQPKILCYKVILVDPPKAEQ
jgi:hypothetical protein